MVSGGTAKCWGYNGHGQLGNGATTNQSTPADVAGLTGATSLVPGRYHHTCARMSNDTVRCWGANWSGPLGDGTTTNRPTPVEVPSFADAVNITLGGNHTCVLLPSGAVKCVGANGQGQLGDGTRTSRLALVEVDGLTPSTKHDPRNVPPGSSADTDWWDLPDSDQDGIPDFWESNGVWVNDSRLDLAAAGASVGERDLFIYVDYEEGHEFNQKVYTHIRDTFSRAPRQYDTKVHFIKGISIPSDAAYRIGWEKKGGKDAPHLGPDLSAAADDYGFTDKGWAGDKRVPQLAKYFVNLDHRSGPTIGYASIKGGGGWVAYNVPDLWQKYLNWSFSDAAVHFSEASNLLHEIGHTLGLDHYGDHSCANWRDPKVRDDADNPKCQAGAKNYKSVMSYAYNVVGIPEYDGDKPNRTRMDYSRDEDPWLDWSTGPPVGYLTFVPGHYGEVPDWYAKRAARGQGSDLEGSEPVSESSDAILATTLPSAFDAFAAEFGVAARPDFPTVTPPSEPILYRNDPVTGVLNARDNAGSSLELVAVEGPDHGTIAFEGLTFTYTPKPEYSGADKVTVRATNGTFSSEPAELTFEATGSQPTTTTTPIPSTTTSSPPACSGSVCFGR